jgi:PAS domain S-box-containing protein
VQSDGRLFESGLLLNGVGSMAKMIQWWLRYGVAVLAAVLSIAAMAIPVIGKGLGSILFLAVLVSTWYGGLGPGLVTAALITGVGVFDLLWLQPRIEPSRIAGIMGYVSGSALITLLVEALHAARRRAEASHRWLTAVLTSIGDAVVATDSRGCVTFLNPVAERLTGWESEQAVARPLTDVFRIVNEETRLPVENPVARVLREKQVVGLANHTVLIARDGTELPIDDSGAPIKENNDAITGVVLVFRDVTQRRLSEAVSARLAAIIESSDDAIIGKDLHGIVTSWNEGAQRLFGYTAEEVIGRPLSLLVPHERADEETAILERLRKGERVDQFESVRITKAGAPVEVSLKISPIRDGSGRIVGASKIARDITERKRLEEERRRRLEELAESNRRKDEFLAMLAHELRNPLAAINNAVQLAVMDAARTQIDWCMDVIHRQVRHLSRLIDDLLEVSRITQGKIQLRKERLDVSAIIERAVESARPLIEDRGHTLEVEVPSESLWLQADPLRLEQIVGNLLTNAAKYTDIGGRVWLRAAQEDNSIVIRVRDTGIGIKPEQLSRIFELFAQGDHSLARSEGGLGIGLTLVRSLTEMHGGSVTAASDGPGKGSEFVVRLAAALAPAGNLPATRASLKPPLAGRARILVVDDNVDVARGLSTVLKLQNHEVWTAHDGPSGIEAARGHHPDVVLLDIGLPGMDGYQVAELLRREDFGKRITIIAVTGYGQEEDRQRARSAGFDQFVTKPVDYSALLALLPAAGSVAS